MEAELYRYLDPHMSYCQHNQNPDGNCLRASASAFHCRMQMSGFSILLALYYYQTLFYPNTNFVNAKGYNI